MVLWFIYPTYKTDENVGLKKQKNLISAGPFYTPPSSYYNTNLLDFLRDTALSNWKHGEIKNLQWKDENP